MQEFGVIVKYPVSSRLKVCFWPGKDRTCLIQGKVTQIANTINVFWVKLSQPLTSELYSFSLDFNQITLLSGIARPSNAETDPESEREIRVESLSIAYQQVTGSVFAPLVDPDYRRDFSASISGIGSDSTDILQPWIHSTNRLLHLVDLVAEINSSRETSRLLGAIMRAAQEIMDAEASSLMLLDENSGELVIAIPTGPAKSEISGVKIPQGKGFGGWVVQNRRPLLVENASQDARFFGDIPGSKFHTRDLLCVPITSPQGKTLGALQVINHKAVGPFCKADISLLSTLSAQAAIALERDRLNKASIQKEKLEQEMQLAADIQAGFQPKNVPKFDCIKLAGESRPARYVGGDYYDFIVLDERRLALVIADVSGKGVSAALMMAELRAVLRAQLKNENSIESVVSGVNEVLVEDTPLEKFATMFVGVIDIVEYVFTYVNAGHDPPLLFRSKNVHELKEGGPIVGFKKGFSFPEGQEKLKPGDLLVLFTDGVSETQGDTEEFFGRDRLVQEILKHRDKKPQNLLRHLQSELKSHQGDQPQYDDVTFLIASVTSGRTDNMV